MLQINNLSFSYKDKKIFQNASYNFENGKLYFLLARNGSGKSTLFNLINGDEEYPKGKVLLKGKVTLHKQNPVYFEDMTVKENIETFIECLNSDRNYNEIIKRYQLEMIASKVVRKLSGGEKQKLYLAITGLLEDDILLYDEADSSLDPVYRKFFYTEILEKEARNGKIVIAISHHITEIINYADEICYLKNQKLFKISPSSLPSNFRDLNEDKMLENIERICEEYEQINH